jgi:hypothetical protein
VKLFQIEEPEGSDEPLEGPGAAVGMALMARAGAVALAVGGNAEILARHEGPASGGDEAGPTALLLALRGRAEKVLARPVTHAVIAGDGESVALRRAAEAAGLAVLRIIATGEAAKLAPGADAADAPALGAAILAEDDAASLPSR